MNKADEIAIARKEVEANGPASALHMAVGNTFLYALRWLVEEQGVDVNIRGDNPNRALHLAAGLGLRRAARYLIDKGADLNALNENQCTPLMVACGWDGKKMAEVAIMLIEAGADVHYVRHQDDQNALTFAMRGADPSVIEALKAAGAEDCTPPAAVLEQERKERMFPGLIERGRQAFKSGDISGCIELLEEAESIEELDATSKRFLSIARKRFPHKTSS